MRMKWILETPFQWCSNAKTRSAYSAYQKSMINHIKKLVALSVKNSKFYLQIFPIFCSYIHHRMMKPFNPKPLSFIATSTLWKQSNLSAYKIIIWYARTVCFPILIISSKYKSAQMIKYVKPLQIKYWLLPNRKKCLKNAVNNYNLFKIFKLLTQNRLSKY